MKRNMFIVLLLSMMGILLTIGCFGVYFVIIEERPSMGKRLSEYNNLFTGFSLATELTPGEPTVTIKRGWFERKKVGLFVIGGCQRLILDRVTITTPLHPQADIASKRLSTMLTNREGLGTITFAEMRRIELRATKSDGGAPFFRAALAEMTAGKKESIILQDAWFCEQDGRWERLRRAWLECQGSQTVCLKMRKYDGSQLSLPLGLTL